MTTVASHSAPEWVAFFNFDKPPSNRPPGSSRPESPINILAVTPRTALIRIKRRFSYCGHRSGLIRLCPPACNRKGTEYLRPRDRRHPIRRSRLLAVRLSKLIGALKILL